MIHWAVAAKMCGVNVWVKHPQVTSSLHFCLHLSVLLMSDFTERQKLKKKEIEMAMSVSFSHDSASAYVIRPVKVQRDSTFVSDKWLILRSTCSHRPMVTFPHLCNWMWFSPQFRGATCSTCHDVNLWRSCQRDEHLSRCDSHYSTFLAFVERKKKQFCGIFNKAVRRLQLFLTFTNPYL